MTKELNLQSVNLANKRDISDLQSGLKAQNRKSKI